MFRRFLLFCGLVLFILNGVFAQEKFSFLTAEENRFVDELTAKMTPKQKIGQMTQLAMDMLFEGDVYVLTNPPKFDEAKLRKAIREYNVGSILNYPTSLYPVPNEWYEFMQRIQNEATSSGAKIPILYGIDAIHGPNFVVGSTLYPQPIGMAATFNRQLAERCASMTAYELKASSIPWNFSPAMDVCRNPVWSRTWESFGEDVYLNQEMGAAMVRGYQGNDIADKDRVAACLKHFTGYGTMSGRDRTPIYLGERQLREYYFPQYQNAIKEGALTIMINSGEINGIPVHTNKWLLTDVLRKEMGFEGLLISDWEDIHKLVEKHHVAKNLKEAVYQAVMAGMDVSMTPVSYDFMDLLKELVDEGRVPMSRIDQSVRRVLAVKVALGLFEKNVWNPSEFPKFGGAEFAATAKQAAEESIVLLRNNSGSLPIRNKKILVTGPTANTQRSLNGGWTYSWQGEEADKYLGRSNTILEALQAEFDGRVVYVEGATYDEAPSIAAAMKAAEDVDHIVICLGEYAYTEFQGDINDLELPKAQKELVHRLSLTGKPITLVLAEGRPRVISSIERHASSIVYAPYPGPHGGDAIAGVLSGRINPSGRLPLTYPRHTNDIVPYDHKFTEGGVYADPETKFNPLFEFGYGLSYTNWDYSNLKVSSGQMTANQGITVTVDVTNTGKRKGMHSVLLFTQDIIASITPSVRRLRKFEKITLAPGQTQTVKFELTAADVAFIGRDNKAITEAGKFKVMVGGEKAIFTYK